MILYDSGGRTIIFTETKNDASELAGLLPNVSRALHGDIAQAQREVIIYITCFCLFKSLCFGFLLRSLSFQVTLSGFRSGKFSVLVATDVAARGLDINDVQLVIQVTFIS